MNFIEKIKLSRVKIDDRYAIRVSQMEEIVRDSDGVYDVVSNAFVYGYIQGMKATEKRSERKAGGSVSEGKMDNEDYRYCIRKLVNMIHDEEGLKQVYNTANRVFMNSEYTEKANPSKQ